MNRNVLQQSSSIAIAAFALIGLTGLVHVVLGISEISSSHGLFDLGVLYLLGGGIALGLSGVFFSGKYPQKSVQFAGIGLMTAFFLAYADIHSWGVTESLTGLDLHGHSGGEEHGHHDDHGHDDHGHDHDDHHHEESAGFFAETIDDIVSHLQKSLVDLGTKLLEAAAILLLTVESFKQN